MSPQTVVAVKDHFPVLSVLTAEAEVRNLFKRGVSEPSAPSR